MAEIVDDKTAKTPTEEKTTSAGDKFDLFLKELQKAEPDMEIIKDGLKNFGTMSLSETQKENFMKALYPDLTSSSLSQGFEDVSRLKTVLNAVVEIQKEDELIKDRFIKLNAGNDTVVSAEPSVSDETIKSILAPEGGKNALDTLIINAYAADFKSDKITDPETREILKNNKSNIDETLKLFAQIKSPVLQDLLETSRNGEYKAIIKNPYYSESVTSFINSAEAHHEDEGVTSVGGIPETKDGVSIAPGEAPAAVTIGEKEAEDKNIANIEPGPKDNSKENFKPEIVREQDIIKYMFEKWFLEFMVSGTINMLNKVVNGAVNYLAEHLEMPGGSHPEYVTANTASAKYLQKTTKNLENSCDEFVNPQNRFYKAMYKCLTHNAEKNVDSWNIPNVDGQPLFDLADKHDRDMMIKFKRAYEANPTKFKEQLKAFDQFVQSDSKQIKNMLKVAAKLALVQHLSANIDKDFGPQDEASASTRMFAIADDLHKSMVRITMQVEKDYRLQKGLTPDEELGKDAKKEVETKAQVATMEYIQHLTDAANNTHDNLKQYYKSVTDHDKQKYKTEVSNGNMQLDSLLDGNFEFSSLKKADGKPMSLRELAADDARAARIEEMYTGLIKIDAGANETSKEANDRRKESFKKMMESGDFSRKSDVKKVVNKVQKEQKAIHLSDLLTRSSAGSGMLK